MRKNKKNENNISSGLWKCLFSFVNNFITRHHPTLASEEKCHATYFFAALQQLCILKIILLFWFAFFLMMVKY